MQKGKSQGKKKSPGQALEVVQMEFEIKPTQNPVEKIDKSRGWVRWGERNTFPQEMLDLFEQSAYNQAIISGKAELVAGNGIIIENEDLPTQVVAEINAFIKNEAGTESLKSMLNAHALDLELYGGMAIECIPNKLGTKIARLDYIDIGKLRWAADKQKIYFSENWFIYNQTLEKTGFKALVPYMGKKSLQEPSFVVTFRAPVKDAKYYPKPSYIGGIKPIRTDVEITNYHYNMLLNEFTGGTMVVLNDGEPPTKEQKAEVEAKFKRKLTGTDKAGGVVIVFSRGKDREPTIMNLSGNDLDKRFDQLDKTTQQKIFTAHKVTSPMLFGIKTEGQLGGRSELLLANELFQRNYIDTRQGYVEDFYNFLLKINGIDAEIEILKKPLISTEIPISEQTIAEILTTQEKRDLASEKLGIELPRLDSPQAPPPGPAQFMNDTDKYWHDLFCYSGEQKGREIMYSRDVPHLYGEHELELFELGMNILKFQDPGTIDLRVISAIGSGQFRGATEIATALGESLADTLASLKRLQEEGLVTEAMTLTEEGLAAVDVQELDPASFEIRYSYEVRPRFGAQIIPGSRAFCRALINLDKLYTRKEINVISGFRRAQGVELWDTWLHRGGWYRRPGTTNSVPACRHVWQQHIVRV